MEGHAKDTNVQGMTQPFDAPMDNNVGQPADAPEPPLSPSCKCNLFPHSFLILLLIYIIFWQLSYSFSFSAVLHILAQNIPPLDDLCNLIDPPNNDVEDNATHDSDVDRLHHVRCQHYILYMMCYYYFLQFSLDIVIT
jgi:hypothetical protein